MRPLLGSCTLALALAYAACAAGCAGATAKKATKADTNGIRYYRPVTYYLVKPNYAEATVDVTQWHGPDTSEVYAIDPYAYMATNNTEITFANGMLSKVNSTTDSTKIAVDTIQALGEIGKKALEVAAAAAMPLKAASADPTTATTGKPPVYLFADFGKGPRQIYPVLPASGGGGGAGNTSPASGAPVTPAVPSTPGTPPVTTPAPVPSR
jgi:hypothetical protein